MLTNILVIVALIVIVIDFYVMYRFYMYITSDIHFNRTEIMTNYRTVKDIYPLLTIKTDNINDTNK